jgi:hypothetical protein
MRQRRPPGLAHAQFVAQRENLLARSLLERFEYTAQSNLWGARTSIAGLGSEYAATKAMRDGLPPL